MSVKYKHIINVVICFFTIINILSAQEFTPTYYTSKDGIALGFHGYIVQDYKGQIWTTSQGGLTKFNGKDFKVYTFDKTSNKSLYVDEYSPIFESQDSMLWIGNEKGVYMYDPFNDKFRLFEVDIPIQYVQLMTTITYITEDKNGCLWLGCPGGLYCFDRKTEKWSFFESLPSIKLTTDIEPEKTINIIKKDLYDDNILWLGGYSRLYKFDLGKKEYLQVWDIPNLHEFKVMLIGIQQVSKDKFYLGLYGGGLQLFDVNNLESKTIPLKADVAISNVPFKIVRDIQVLDSNRILCTNYSGALFIYDRKLDKTHYLDNINIIKKSHQLLSDSDGNIWVTSEEGITKLKRKTVFSYSKNNDNGDYEIWDAKYDPINNCYLYFNTNTKWCFDCFDSIKTKFLNFSIESDIPYSGFCYDNLSQSFFTISESALLQIKTKELRFRKLFDLPKHQYQNIYSTKEFIYLYHQNKLDIYNKKGEIISQIVVPDSIIINDYHTKKSDFIITSDDFIYYKTNNQIINCSLDNTFKSLFYDPSMSILDFKVIEDNVYLATTSGLHKCHVNTIGAFVVDNNFIDPGKSLDMRHINVVGDHLYMTNGPGIFGYNYKTDQRVLQISESDNITYVKGLNSFGNKLFSFSSDRFYQVVLTNKLEKIKNITLKDIVISNLKAVDVNTKKLDLQANQNGISLSWESCYFGQQNEINYFYKLIGINDHWVNNENSTRVNFNNLGSGQYSLLIRAESIGDSYESEILQFTIHPPWWKTWWFILSAITSILLIIIYFYRQRIQKIKFKSQHQQEMAELELTALRAQMNPHFIFNSLNSIKRLIQREENEDAIDYLANFAMMIRQILSNSDKKLISLEDELDFCKRYLEMEKLRFQDKFSYEINIDENVNLETTAVPPLILQPYIENALWHGIMNSGKKGILKLNVKQTGLFILIEIDDNGIGRKKSLALKLDSPLHKKSRGMDLSKKRSELSELLFNQKIEIEIIDKHQNEIPLGTTIKIKLEQF